MNFVGAPQHLQGFLHYYKAYPRTRHYLTPVMIPNGPHRIIDVLGFGPQWNTFRRSL